MVRNNRKEKEKQQDRISQNQSVYMPPNIQVGKNKDEVKKP
jgi:hypothetical protein